MWPFLFFIFCFASVVMKSHPMPSSMFSHYLPESYDSSKGWEHCLGFAVVQNQQNCSSCCAVALSNTLSVRECMLNHRNVLLSANQVWDCSATDGTCNGGVYFDNMIDQMVYGSHARRALIPDHCSPYVPRERNESLCRPVHDRCSFSSTEEIYLSHSVSSNELGVGLKGFYAAENGMMAARAIMAEIWVNGPVVAILDVSRSDWPFFSNLSASDVFVPDLNNWKSNPSINASRHCIMVYGWGKHEVTGLNYWLVHNSYGVSWSNQGRGKIIRGYNWLENEWKGLSTRYKPCQNASYCISPSLVNMSNMANRLQLASEDLSKLLSTHFYVYVDSDSVLQRPTNYEILAITFFFGLVLCGLTLWLLPPSFRAPAQSSPPLLKLKKPRTLAFRV